MGGGLSLVRVAERLERLGLAALGEIVRSADARIGLQTQEIERLKTELAVRTRLVADQARALEALRQERDVLRLAAVGAVGSFDADSLPIGNGHTEAMAELERVLGGPDAAP